MFHQKHYGEKKLKNTKRTKINSIALIFAFVISTIIVALPTATAQGVGTKTTYPFIGAMPNPVGVNQDVLLHIGISDALPSVAMGWEGITVTVTGMTCSHCEATVKRNLEALKGVSNVVADNKSNTVKISGAKINLQKVKETVNGLGYHFEE